MPNTCLFIGRFQPFHKGHLLVVKGMVQACDKIVIGIGSSETTDAENPFTADERRDMIQRALQGEDIIPQHDVTFINVPDYKSDKEWADKCLELAGEVSIVWTGNEDTKRCFEGHNVEIQNIKEVPDVSATEVRKRMAEGGEWKELLPKEVVASIIAIDGVDRVRNK